MNLDFKKSLQNFFNEKLKGTKAFGNRFIRYVATLIKGTGLTKNTSHQYDDNLEAVLKEFLSQNEKKVLLIKGAWGVGKTFRIRKYLEQNQLKYEAGYSYVSLFGLEDSHELIEHILANTRIVDNAAIQRTIDILKTGGILAFSAVTHKLEMEGIKRKTAEFLVKNLLIVVDDFERHHKDLTINLVMGNIAKLKEQFDCRLIIVCNTGTLTKKDQKQFALYREKVVDAEFEYAPSIENNVDLIFPQKPCASVWDVIDRLKLINLRILKQIYWAQVYFQSVINELNIHNDVKERFLKQVASLTSIYYSNNSGGIDIRKLPGYTSIAVSKFFDKKQSFANNEDLAHTYVKLLEYNPMDYDNWIADYLMLGFCNLEKLKKSLQNINSDTEKQKIRSEIEVCNRQVFSNFTKTSEAVGALLTSIYEKYRDKLSLYDVIQIDNAFSVLRESEDHSELNYWFEHSLKELNAEEIKNLLSTYGFDKEIVEKLTTYLKKFIPEKSFKELIIEIAHNNFQNSSQFPILRTVSSEQYYEWLKGEEDENLLRQIYSFLTTNFNGYGGDEINFAKKEIHAALCRLASESIFNKRRIKIFFGIDIDSCKPADKV